MAHQFVRHTVADYGKWRAAYDDHEATRQEYGLKELGVHRGADDPNDITVVFEVESVERANEFAQSEDLKTKMMEAGVQGMPDIWFTD
ncbi:MAG: cyclase [Chloroflexi bacterium]|nr:cyclase [Chloroflexota bacterium]MCI0776042.1 cyclase [Chloroflexota bacterium]MCI0804700.1 cyclase [Chloroflexota bacterium]MCI0809678.1 cyclase [Chloroflexota bacterium]MCI0835188.1 cyclase [Chloroflexota bacterium]